MLPQEKLLLQENETQLRKQEKLPPEGESVQLHQEKVLDKILFQIQLTPYWRSTSFQCETAGIGTNCMGSFHRNDSNCIHVIFGLASIQT